MIRKNDREQKSQNILEATRKVIAKVGFQGANLEMIAKNAGLSKAALYLYFPSKDHLFLRAVEDGFDKMISNVTGAVEETEGVMKKLKRFIAAQLSFMEEHRNFLKALLLERRGLNSGPRDKGFLMLREKAHQYTDYAARIIEEGIEGGMFRPLDPRKCAFSLIQLIRGAVVARVIGISDDPLDKEIAHVEEIFFRGVLTGRSGG